MPQQRPKAAKYINILFFKIGALIGSFSHPLIKSLIILAVQKT